MKRIWMNGWVARDDDNSLFLYLKKPERGGIGWCCDNSFCCKLDETSFPSVLPDSEPMLVTITIEPN